MALKKVPKTGVYRNKAGHAVYLAEGAAVSEDLLKEYEHDAAATKERGKEPERSAFRTVLNAPQDQKAEDTWSDRRMIAGAPENRMEAPAANRSDAELAEGAAKGKKS